MGVSILKSLNLGSLLKLNLSTSGVSFSVGPKGARLNYKLLGQSQGRITINAQKSVFGIPIRYRKTLLSKQEFKWSSKYGVCNKQMNYEHKVIINELNELQQPGNLEEILSRIEVHTKTHFENEELLLQHYQVPNYQEHKQAHDKLLASLTTLAPKDSYKHLTDWWKEHLTTLDASYKDYVKKK